MDASARVHVHTTFSYLGNGWMECAEICRVVKYPLIVLYRTQRWGTSAHAHMVTPCLYLRYQWAHRAEAWPVVRDSLSISYTFYIDHGERASALWCQKNTLLGCASSPISVGCSIPPEIC